MKAAFSYWGQRIAPVFDSTGTIHVVETDNGQVINRTEQTLQEEMPVQRALGLLDLGIHTLVCGAISRSMYELITAYGIRIVPFVAGDLDEVVRAWLKDNLDTGVFTMPGCRPRGPFRDQKNADRGSYRMNRNGRGRSAKGRGQNQTAAGQGRGQNQTAAGQGRSRNSSPAVTNAVSNCLCPNCGHNEPHERGNPCIQKRCPKCGAAMTRG